MQRNECDFFVDRAQDMQSPSHTVSKRKPTSIISIFLEADDHMTASQNLLSILQQHHETETHAFTDIDRNLKSINKAFIKVFMQTKQIAYLLRADNISVRPDIEINTVSLSTAQIQCLSE